MPSEQFWAEQVRFEQERADREGARVRKDWAIASFGIAVAGFCAGIMVMGWHP